jgi:RNA polymerase sigma factor (sigma-70 family)
MRLLRGSSDERLVAAVRAGDERAFEAAYDRYHRQLLAFCRHMLGTREEAEDALQHVFISAHAGLLADDRPVQLRPWLYAIARNRCLSVLRARHDVGALDAGAEPSTDGLAVAAEVERRQDLRDTLADLARLPHDQRAALVLAELGDLNHEEIAGVLDVRTAKVKALVFQAREALAGYRDARAANCGEVREQLATLHGSALRRRPLRRHVDVCAGCAQFEREVARQRAVLALVLPVIPSLALRHLALSAAAAGEGGAVLAGAAAAGSSGVAVKALTAVAIVAGTGGGAAAVHELRTPAPDARSAAVTAAPRASAPVRASTAATTPVVPLRVTAPAAPPAATRAHSPARQKRAKGGGRTPGRPAHARGPARAAERSNRPVTASRGRSAQAHARKLSRPARAAQAAKPTKPAKPAKVAVKVAKVPKPLPAAAAAALPGRAAGHARKR